MDRFCKELITIIIDASLINENPNLIKKLTFLGKKLNLLYRKFFYLIFIVKY